MSEAQARTRRQERVEALCAATIRAIAGERSLSFRGGRLHRGDRALPAFAPHLHLAVDSDDFASFRGAADGLALRLVHSDAARHESLAPADPVERLVFDWLEQFRVEALVPESLAGVAGNVRHRHEAWSLAYHHAGHTNSARGLLLYTLAQVARAHVSGEPVVEATEDLIEATRFALAPRIGAALAKLRRARHDQQAYAAPARAIAAAVAAMLREEGGGATTPASAGSRDDELRSVFGLLLEDAAGVTGERFATAVSGRSRVFAANAGRYRVFTSAWDREADAIELARREVLAACRERLDQRIAAQGVRRGLLARQLRALFAAPQPAGWDGAQEDGVIDGRRLARLVASPGETRVFKRERTEPFADCALTFLVDCSGSMKAHAEDIAVLVDATARALGEAGAVSEVLGFSTGAWNGGRAQRDWLRAGRPADPGRLNERLHLVFKPFDASWRKARPGIAALLHAELFREGLDGEALEWAAARLLARGERHKVLVVVSDGSPMDSATALANDVHYLDEHLRQVAGRIEQGGRIELHGLGVGLDLSRYYASSHVLDLDGRIGNAVFGEVLALLGGRRIAPSPPRGRGLG